MEDKNGGRLERAHQFAQRLCANAGRDVQFLEQFWEALCGQEDILEEFCYYAENQKFACHVSIQGFTVIDVMVWQIDHFKAAMDLGDPGMRSNGDQMLLMAFDTFLKMRREPENYIRRMREETGTDYPEKY